MSLETYFYAVVTGINVLSSVVAFMLFATVWLYLSKKPMGMQTPLDQMVKDLLVLSYICSILAGIHYIECDLFINYPITALIYIYLLVVVGHSMFLQIIFTVSLRYLYIFHSTWINEVDDSTIKKVSRFITFSVSIFMASFELLSYDYKSGKIFLKMTGMTTKKAQMLPNPTVKIMVMLVAITVLSIQLRIEVAKRQSKEKTPDFGYSFWTLRSMAFMLTAGSALTILWFVDKKVTGIRENQQAIHVITSIIMFNILPAIMVLRNSSMTCWAKNYFKWK